MKIGVIMGGISSEREISFKTGEAMIKALKNTQYDTIKIIINDKKDLTDIPRIDFALIALHGKFGEDGTIQTYLDIMGIPYSGCDALTSSICMDKNITKKILKADNIKTANWTTLKSTSIKELEKAYNLNFPVFVKPNSGGSSVGTFFVKDKCDLLKYVKESLKWDMEVMVEEYIKGEEITCPILNGKTLPIIKIKPNSMFFDYNSKYDENGSSETIAEYNKVLTEKINKIALECWNSLNCSIYARIDMILTEKDIYVLEINTLPGMTVNSLFPKSAKVIGKSMKALIEEIIDSSLEKRAFVRLKKEIILKMGKEIIQNGN